MNHGHSAKQKSKGYISSSHEKNRRGSEHSKMKSSNEKRSHHRNGDLISHQSRSAHSSRTDANESSPLNEESYDDFNDKFGLTRVSDETTEGFSSSYHHSNDHHQPRPIPAYQIVHKFSIAVYDEIEDKRKMNVLGTEFTFHEFYVRFLMECQHTGLDERQLLSILSS